MNLEVVILHFWLLLISALERASWMRKISVVWREPFLLKVEEKRFDWMKSTPFQRKIFEIEELSAVRGFDSLKIMSDPQETFVVQE